MQNPNEYLKNPIIKSGTLPKTGGQYHLCTLSPESIDMMLQLQDTIHDSLSPENKSFILMKSRNFFEDHLAHGNIVLGIFHDGHLIAQSILVTPEKGCKKEPMTDMAPPARPEKTTVIQGILVHPDYRGNNLMTEMVSAWLEIAKNQGRVHALAEVSVDNMHSWAVLLKEGLAISSIGKDPTDGTALYNMHANVKSLINKRLKPDFNKSSAKKKSVACPKKALEEQKELLAKGYKGLSYDPANENIRFTAGKKKKPGNSL